MPPTADSPAPLPQSAETGASGKVLIIGILTVAFIAAGGSWLFRYNATHRAAEFWGPQVAQLIRDAPLVEFRKLSPPLEPMLPARESGQLEPDLTGPELINITTAPGLVHLRNALVEDRSFDWQAPPPESKDANDGWQYALVFREDSTRAGAILLFSPKGEQLLSLERPEVVVSSKPIAAGLQQMFAEFLAMPAENATETAAESSAPADSER
jgi:hypothetical protein